MNKKINGIANPAVKCKMRNVLLADVFVLKRKIKCNFIAHYYAKKQNN
jgi:hypothetical protein